MVDFFFLLDEPRKPWLEPEPLKTKFLSLSSATHPDRVHQGSEAEKATAQQKYTELNTAYQCLRHDKTRLAHLLELERGRKPHELQRIPSGLMNISLEVGQLCREADSLIMEKPSLTSPVLKVRHFELGQLTNEKILALQGRLNRWREELSVELKQVDKSWGQSASDPSARASLLDKVEELYRLFGFLGRWTDQLSERIARLAF
jgi:hypothetical protein